MPLSAGSSDSTTPPRARTAFQAIAILLALFMLAVAAETTVRATEPVPFWDQWVQLTAQDMLAQPFAQHNEHRLAVPRLFFAIDSSVFHGTNAFDVAVMFAMTFAHALLLAWAARSSSPLQHEVVLSVAFSICLLFALRGYDNFIWGFQVQFVGVYLCATCAFVAIARERTTWLSAVVGAAFVSIAPFMMANGVLVGPLAIAIAVVVRRPRAQLVSLVLTWIAVVAFYAHGYESPAGHVKPWESIQRPWLVARYAAVYLGSPLGLNVGIAGVLGALGTVGAIALLWNLAKRRRELAAHEWILPAILLFIGATALVTALGRLGFPLKQALATRYRTPAVIFWAAMLFVAFRTSGSAAVRRGVVAGACVFALILASVQFFNRSRAFSRAFRIRLGGAALLADAGPEGALSKLYPHPWIPFERAQILRANRLSVFHDEWSRWLGSPLDAHVRRNDRACEGRLERAVRVPSLREPAFQVEGWAWSTSAGVPASHVIVTDGHGVVVGYALTGWARSRTGDWRRIRDGHAGFEGFVGRYASTGLISAHALLQDDTVACKLAGAASL